MSSKRAASLSGIAFIVCFLASVAASNVPKNTATDKAWIADYATHGKQFGHFATGVLLVIAGLSLMSFLTHLWTKVAEASAPGTTSPHPIVAAGVSAACICIGGVLMAGSSGASLFYSQPIPGPDVLRLSNDIGFGAVGLAGMFAAAVSIASLTVQARRAGVFAA